MNIWEKKVNNMEHYPDVKKKRVVRSKAKINAFFSDLAVCMNTTNVDVARSAYYGLIKMVMAGLSSDFERCDLPDFGCFKTVHLKARFRYSAPLKVRKWIGPTKTFKFLPYKKVRFMFNGNMDGKF